MKRVFVSSKEAVVVSAFSLALALMLYAGHMSIISVAAAQTSTSTNQTISLTVNQTITLTLSSSSLTLASLTPGVPVAATSSVSVSTNSATGWSLMINRVSAPSTLASSSITFPDYTAWNPASPNATTTNLIGANFHFRVMQTGTAAGIYSSTYWGASDTDGAAGAKYAGTPTTAQTVASTSTYSGAAQTVVLKVRADSPATQQATNYTGQITITAITNP